MNGWGARPLETVAVLDRTGQVACYVCQSANSLDSEFCRQCRAPLALALQAEVRGTALHMLAVAGTPGCGKTVYLGMLTDLLSRQHDNLQVLARGAFSVALQQQSISALSQRQFPPPTSCEPEGWNWVHCEVTTPSRRRKMDVVMPDIAGEAFTRHFEDAASFPVVPKLLSRCAGAMVLVDTEAVESGDAEQDLRARQLIDYLLELDNGRKTGWPRRPVAVIFTKADCSVACLEDPEGYARLAAPSLHRQCRARLKHCDFFASTVVAACARLEMQGETVDIPLRIEPRGVAEPFKWLVERLAK